MVGAGNVGDFDSLLEFLVLGVVSCFGKWLGPKCLKLFQLMWKRLSVILMS